MWWAITVVIAAIIIFSYGRSTLRTEMRHRLSVRLDYANDMVAARPNDEWAAGYQRGLDEAHRMMRP
jgi:hypothetical protein